jgi:hypothetical protein
MNGSFPTTAALAFACLLTACERSATPPAPVSAPSPVAAPAPALPLERILGSWQRTDGSYVLQLRSAGTNNLLDAAYFNPNPIHVERAEASPDQNGLKLTVVLRDTGYPGCIYTLSYDNKTDQLTGRYYQAATHDTYDVLFMRVRGDQ